MHAVIIARRRPKHTNTCMPSIHSLPPWHLQNFYPAAGQRSCGQCDLTAGNFYDTVDGFGTSQTWLASSSATQCSCASSGTRSSIQAVVFANGAYMNRCVQCPTGYTAGRSNSTGEAACIPPAGTSFTSFQSAEQQWNAALRILGMPNIPYGTATTVCAQTMHGNTDHRGH
jgi:hypothetical protein